MNECSSVTLSWAVPPVSAGCHWLVTLSNGGHGLLFWREFCITRTQYQSGFDMQQKSSTIFSLTAKPLASARNPVELQNLIGRKNGRPPGRNTLWKRQSGTEVEQRTFFEEKKRLISDSQKVDLDPDSIWFCFGGGWSRNRTGDTRIFSPLLYRLSYPAIPTQNGIPSSRSAETGHPRLELPQTLPQTPAAMQALPSPQNHNDLAACGEVTDNRAN